MNCTLIRDLFLAGLASSALLACGGEPTLGDVIDGRAEVTGQGVLVIAIDGLRWDHTSLAGYDRNTTPFLAKLADQGISFSDAWSATPSLVGSHLALLSGSDPSLAQPPTSFRRAQDPESREEEAWFVPEDLPLLGALFLSKGWNTAAFVDDPMIAELRGFSAGFRSFVEFGGDPLKEERSIGVFGVGGRFVRWVNKRPLDEDWFAYLHMHDLERTWTPAGNVTKTRGVEEATANWLPRQELRYSPPLGVTEPLFHVLPPSRASVIHGITMGQYELRYDRGLRALDANLARIIGHMDEFGRADEVTVVIVGSFGTELGEHGLYLQAGLAEEEDLRVPLVIRPSAALRKKLGWEAPSDGAPGRTSEALASLLDVAPTLVDLFDLPATGRMQGLPLSPAMTGKNEGVRRRLFASAPMCAGSAVVEKGGVLTLYRPDRIPQSLRRSWGIGPPVADGTPGSLDRTLTHLRGRPNLRSGLNGTPLSSAGEGRDAAREASLEALLAAQSSWESLLLRERTALHFGGEDSDRPSIGEFRALQQASSLD
ncbi:MAG: arylsulfatase A-like enzyme [Planctomycetota bacterium]|jgi:arylsulfatase A-like enzyme